MIKIIQIEIGPLEDSFSLFEEHPCEVSRTIQVYKAPLIDSEE